ncbi:MAG TPA: tetratricopeptide repeat protein [Flavobacteriales bacterium]|nr:tetratricopeptide repeat protein [Flavobacteriales bacterium]
MTNARSPLLLSGLLCLSMSVMAQDARLLVTEGDSLLAAASPAKAMAKFNAAVQLSPSADTYAARSSGWYYMGKYDKFLEDVRNALDRDSLNVRANHLRALHALRTNDNPAAIHFATRAIEGSANKEQHLRAMIVRGEAEAALGMTDKAIADLSAGLEECRPEDTEVMKVLARLLDAANDPAASLAVLEKLCEMEPGEIGNWSNRGFELIRLERFQEAVDVLDRALKLDKDEPVVLSNKAYAVLKLGRPDEAFTLVSHSLRSDKANPYALRTRALIYLRKGERGKACDDLTLAKAMGGAPGVDALVKEHCAGLPTKP